MRPLACSMVLSGLLTATIAAQKNETQPTDAREIVRVETAQGHLTVIELADPVEMVAVGDPGAFTVERRENKVFIRPAEEDAATNLLIWTSAGRFAYELIAPGAVERMHFAIDQEPATVSANLSTPRDNHSSERFRRCRRPC